MQRFVHIVWYEDEEGEAVNESAFHNGRAADKEANELRRRRSAYEAHPNVGVESVPLRD